MARKKSSVTIRDIAKKANVSTATVSRTFNGTGFVKKETQEAIMEAAQELGYVYTAPKEPASSLIPTPITKKGKKAMILINIPSLSNPFYSDIVQGIKSSAANNGFDFLLYSGSITEQNINKFLDILTSTGCSGIITLNLLPISLLRIITEYVPVVQCCEYIENPYASSVGINDFTAVQCAMDYFLSIGRKKISLINGPLSFRYSQNRRDAYISIMESAGIAFPPQWIIQLPDLNPDMAFSSVVKLLSADNPPDCFFAVSDVLAAAAIRAIQYCNLKVPEDVLVIGFDNTIISQLTTPSITTVGQPQFQLGFLAGELLLEKITNPLSEVKHMKLNTELILRESTLAI